MSIQPYTLILGQMLIALLFLVSVIIDWKHWDATLDLMRSKNLPLPTLGLYLALFIKFTASVMLLSNIYVTYAALALGLFTLLCNVIFNDFWNKKDESRIPSTLQFFSNIAIIGGLVVLIG